MGRKFPTGTSILWTSALLLFLSATGDAADAIQAAADYGRNAATAIATGAENAANAQANAGIAVARTQANTAIANAQNVANGAIGAAAAGANAWAAVQRYQVSVLAWFYGGAWASAMYAWIDSAVQASIAVATATWNAWLNATIAPTVAWLNGVIASWTVWAQSQVSAWVNWLAAQITAWNAWQATAEAAKSLIANETALTVDAARQIAATESQWLATALSYAQSNTLAFSMKQPCVFAPWAGGGNQLAGTGLAKYPIGILPVSDASGLPLYYETQLDLSNGAPLYMSATTYAMRNWAAYGTLYDQQMVTVGPNPNPFAPGVNHTATSYAYLTFIPSPIPLHLPNVVELDPYGSNWVIFRFYQATSPVKPILVYAFDHNQAPIDCNFAWTDYYEPSATIAQTLTPMSPPHELQPYERTGGTFLPCAQDFYESMKFQVDGANLPVFKLQTGSAPPFPQSVIPVFLASSSQYSMRDLIVTLLDNSGNELAAISYSQMSLDSEGRAYFVVVGSQNQGAVKAALGSQPGWNFLVGGNPGDTLSVMIRELLPNDPNRQPGPVMTMGSPDITDAMMCPLANLSGYAAHGDCVATAVSTSSGATSGTVSATASSSGSSGAASSSGASGAVSSSVTSSAPSSSGTGSGTSSSGSSSVASSSSSSGAPSSSGSASVAASFPASSLAKNPPDACGFYQMPSAGFQSVPEWSFQIITESLAKTVSFQLFPQGTSLPMYAYVPAGNTTNRVPYPMGSSISMGGGPLGNKLSIRFGIALDKISSLPVGKTLVLQAIPDSGSSCSLVLQIEDGTSSREAIAGSLLDYPADGPGTLATGFVYAGITPNSALTYMSGLGFDGNGNFGTDFAGFSFWGVSGGSEAQGQSQLQIFALSPAGESTLVPSLSLYGGPAVGTVPNGTVVKSDSPVWSFSHSSLNGADALIESTSSNPDNENGASVSAAVVAPDSVNEYIGR